MRTGMLHIHDGVMTPEEVEIDSILPHPDNANNGDQDAVEESMEINGMYRPIYCQRSTRYVVGGHTTWAAANALGATWVPVIFLDIDDATARRIVAVDNRSAALARIDNGLLLPLLVKIEEESTLLGTGYVDRDVEMLKKLQEVRPDYTNTSETHEKWPTLFLTVPKHLKEAFYQMTEPAQGDHERLESLLRMAGWEG